MESQEINPGIQGLDSYDDIPEKDGITVVK